MNTYLCIVCGFIYDESAGRPEDGIPAGTLWSAVAEDSGQSKDLEGGGGGGWEGAGGWA